jgi:hypothetical protein
VNQAVQRQDLFVICSALQSYVKDVGASPESLDELVKAKYVAAIPTDPITHQTFSILECAHWDDQHMDPVQTIPGQRNIYSYSVPISTDHGEERGAEREK